MNDFGDLLGTPYAPVSKIAPVKDPHGPPQFSKNEPKVLSKLAY